ncbi:hypothetical protein R1sor_007830 [Riccia sorocarpa]|uniref:Reverse transcriptase domain-containing protein n=1 Tax=Riccia sorocarpa TaxID=122646 RepID=A0ABD3HU00_9MARC
MGGEDRIKAIQTWLRSNGKGTLALALQELKAREENLDFNIRRVIQEAEVVVDYSESDRGGAALVMDPRVKVLNKGVRGDSSCAWAIVEIQGVKMGLASVYTSHDNSEKYELYRWLDSLDQELGWLMLGDWNTVLATIDSAGPTAVLKGSAKEQWLELDQQRRLSDLYKLAEHKHGPRFTRQALRGGRFDQSRLDRVYTTKGGKWIKEVKDITHDANEALSDHIPVYVNIILRAPSRCMAGKRSSYLKLDIDTMKNPQQKAVIKEAWESGWVLTQDPILAWEMAWGRVREVYKTFRREDREWISELQSLQGKLAAARQNIQEYSTTADRVSLVALEREVHDGELLEANILRIRCRNQWLKEGDDCTKYFFQNHTSVIKLLSNGGERRLLKNWRPISLLTFTYKLIGKILAERLKVFLPKLVDQDQTGFIEGRNIMDNVLSIKLCQDLTHITEEASVFCQLDFDKAFDMVQHKYLWETMRTMGFHYKFIQMVSMLVGGGKAKVYLNGRFTKTISLERGVRQVCPVSPLLFTISTQPLMCLLREEERLGRLKGVSVPKGRPLLHKLFADDSGVAIAGSEQNFSVLKQTIEQFERIAGARLNISKSIILPMVLDRSEAWLSQTGCRVLGQQEISI